MSESDTPNFVCPESTIESANRRNFIKKTAIVAVAAGLGGTIAGSDIGIAPVSSARSDGPPVCAFCATGVAVKGKSCSSIGIWGCSASEAGVYGSSTSSVGVSGASLCGIGVAASSLSSLGLCVVSGQAVTGRFKNDNPKLCCCHTALIQFESSAVVCCVVGKKTTSPVDWNIGASGSNNALKVPVGDFYIQHANPTTNPPSVVITKCGAVGINTMSPEKKLCVNGIAQISSGLGLNTQNVKTTLTVNGSMSARVAFTGSKNYCMGASDFAVIACSPPVTVTLPPAATAAGMIVYVKNTGTASVTIAPISGDNIEGATTKTLTKQFDGLELISNGGHRWLVLGSSIGDAFTS
jgi:hypothetical protein